MRIKCKGCDYIFDSTTSEFTEHCSRSCTKVEELQDRIISLENSLKAVTEALMKSLEYPSSN